VGSEKCDEVFRADTLKKDWVDGAWGLMADYCMIMQTDYNVSCPDTTDYVTVGNSRLAGGYQNSVGTHHRHLRSRFNETVLLDIRQWISL